MNETWEQMELRHAKERAEMVSLEKARSVSLVSDGHLQVRDDNRPRLSTIAAVVAGETGVSVSELRGPKKIRPIAYARFRAFRMARRAGYSLPDIGHFFRKDHTSVLHGVRRAEELGL